MRVPVRHEEVRVEREPITDGRPGEHRVGEVEETVTGSRTTHASRDVFFVGEAVSGRGQDRTGIARVRKEAGGCEPLSSCTISVQEKKSSGARRR